MESDGILERDSAQMMNVQDMHAAKPVAVVVERDEGVRTLIQRLLEDLQFHAIAASTSDEAAEALRSHPVSLLLMDPRLEGLVSLDRLGYGMHLRPAPLMVMILEDASPAESEAIHRSGVFDVLLKPVGESAARLVIQRAQRQIELLTEMRRLRQELSNREGQVRMVGRSPSMEQLRQSMTRLAIADGPVWFSGHAGTGKELAARSLHAASSRRDGPFVVVNCSAFASERMDPLASASIVAPELGSMLEQARTGSVLLDRITDMPLQAQDQLARALGEDELPDARILTAANNHPDPACQHGQLVPELKQRLGASVVHCPDLTERVGDIPLLSQHFVTTLCEINRLPPMRIAPEALELLESYPWPGNVRELRDAVEHAVIFAGDRTIRPQDLPNHLRETTTSTAPSGTLSTRTFKEAKREVVESFERGYVIDLLERYGGNVTWAAYRAGLLRSAFQRLLRKYELRSKDFRNRPVSRPAADRPELD